MTPTHADWQTAYACLAVRLGDALNIALNTTPLLRLLEENVCRNYYSKHDPGAIAADGNIPEELCKVKEVQGDLSDINGAFAILVLIPALLAAIPYVTTVKPSNQKRALLISSYGSFMFNFYFVVIYYFYNIFDPRWMWASGMFSFIGGGEVVFYSLISAIIAGSIPHNSLSTFYLYSSASALTTMVIGSATSLSMMKTSNWLPIWIGLAVKLSNIPIIMIFIRNPPETGTDNISRGDFHLVPVQDVDDDDHEIEAASKLDTSDLEADEATAAAYTTSKPTPIWKSTSTQPSLLRKSLRPILIRALQELGNSVHYILAIWASRRYDWTLREVGWVRLGETLLTALLSALLPRLSKTLQQRDPSHSSSARDSDLARICLGFSCVGTVLLGLSWYRFSLYVSLAVMATGKAFVDAYNGYLTATLEKDEIAKVYMILSMVALSAFCVGGSVISGVYSLALRFGSSWETSVPVWMCSVAFVLAWLAMRRG